MNDKYQIVSESYYISEGISPLGLAGAGFAGMNLASGIGLWYLNKVIRTKKILKSFPTPQSMIDFLNSTNDTTAKGAALQLSPDMDFESYKHWVDRNFNPKMGVGKVLLSLIGVYPGIQSYKLYNALRSGKSIAKNNLDNIK